MQSLLRSAPAILISICCMLWSAAPAFAQAQVGASIRPLQLIAAAVTDGVSEPALILGSGQDPHHPVLRPSQRQAMAAADVFLWVGPVLEAAIADAVAGLDSRVVTAADVIGDGRLLRGDSVDPHLWLDTDNAGAIAAVLAAELQRLDPQNAARYRRNLEAFEARLTALPERIGQRLAPHRGAPFAVYHDAFGYFERQFGLDHVISFTGNEQLRPGIRRMLEVRGELREAGVGCLLLEPSVNRNDVRQVIDDEAVRFAVIDVLATDFTPGPGAYADFMLALADRIAACLAGESGIE